MNPDQYNYGGSNYGGNNRSEFENVRIQQNRYGNGILFRASDISIRDITDGTSNTCTVREREFSSNPDKRYHGAWPGAYHNFATYAIGWVMKNHPNTVINAFNGAANFGSRHPGGAHFVFADDHVDFLSENIDSALYEALGTRNGGEVIGEY